MSKMFLLENSIEESNSEALTVTSVNIAEKRKILAVVVYH
jgi:hypothetical protein